MAEHTVYIVDNTLTLLALCGKYPRGVVGAGKKPTNFYCCACLIGKPMALTQLVVDYNMLIKPFFKMCPTADAACAVMWDMADPKCKTCGRPVRDT
jgi:hypothetical protein